MDLLLLITTGDALKCQPTTAQASLLSQAYAQASLLSQAYAYLKHRDHISRGYAHRHNHGMEHLSAVSRRAAATAL
jgi:hypothetical protein